MNCAIASAGMRTARPQLTRGSFLRSSQARIVAGFTARTSLASRIESNLLKWLTSERDSAVSSAVKSGVRRWCGGGVPVVGWASCGYFSRSGAAIFRPSSLLKA